MTNQLTIKQYIESPSVKDRIHEVLKNRASQFIVSLLSTVNSNSNLAKCNPQSVMNAAMTAASLDLPINQNLGYAYIIPYGTEAQFQVGAKGFKQLAMRSGMYKTINETDVKEGEYKGINRLTGEVNFEWYEGEDRDSLKTIGYLSYFKLTNGYEKYRYMRVDAIEKHAKRYSQTYKKGYGNWKDDFDAMARKTVIKLLLSKDGLLSTELQTAIQADQSVLDENGNNYVDNKKLTPGEIAEAKEKERIINHINESKTAQELSQCEEYITDGEMRKLFDDKMDILEREASK